jgi:hypothetical protein
MSSHTLLGDDSLKRLVTIEIEPEMIRASRMFYPANRRVFDDPRSSFAIDDARSYFASRNERYDLILSEPSNPWVAGVSGLFTTEFYAHVGRFLTPHGVFGQWLHLSEISDGLVLGVVRALAENFPSYALYAVGGHDILIVASRERTLPEPDWSVMRNAGTQVDLQRVYPLTPGILNGLHIADGATLAPLTTGGGANSDFYPTLDLGAERTRYMAQGAHGFVGLAGERFAIAPMLERRRVGVEGEWYSPLSGVPRLSAQEFAARLRDGRMEGMDADALMLVDRMRSVDRIARSGEAPIEWHIFVANAVEAEAARSGGTVGVADTAFFARVRGYLTTKHAPAPASAAIDFVHGLASWDFAEASRAAEVLIPLASHGDHWISPDLLREGTVVARLRVGDVRGARMALDALRAVSPRASGDVRGELIAAWVERAERPAPVRTTQR